MPASAPDNPAAYRGSRFRMVNGVSGLSVESGGTAVPWLRPTRSGYRSVEGGVVGNVAVNDGRRSMVWFFRLAERAPFPPYPRGPMVAVLDVLVLRSGSAEGGQGFGTGCGPGGDTVIIDGDDGWRLNGRTGRIEPTDPDDAVCED